jgi:ATP-dependent Clp protease adaptor protein ClpS
VANATPTISPTELVTIDDELDTPYVVLLWNDPVNLQQFVVHVISQVFGYSKAKAQELMQAAEHANRTPVWNGARAEAEMYAVTLGSYGLNATIAEDR